MRLWIATRVSYRYKTLSSAKEELVNNFMKILNSNLDVCYKKEVTYTTSQKFNTSSTLRIKGAWSFCLHYTFEIELNQTS